VPPPQTDLIVNGDFEDVPPSWNGSASWIIVSGAPGSMNGWTGSDIEWGLESLYRPGGSTTNRVIEMDGNGGSAVTEITQSFTVGGQVTAVLTFDFALRANVATDVGEGFRVDILDSLGNVIQTQTYLPTTNIWQTATVSVPFDALGTYSIRFTELGPNNSLGAIIDNVSLVICFTAGTLIETPDGLRRVEDLRPGDLVQTADDGAQPIRWVGQRTIRQSAMAGDPRLWPVTIRAGAFGPGQPSRDLKVSRQHRILRSGWSCELHFGEPEVLVPAHRLVNGRSVRLDLPDQDVTYVHFLCDRHQIVLAEGLATESFYPSALSVRGVAAEAQAELLLIFPELHKMATAPLDLARPVVEGKLARLVA
jgi:Hint domain